MKENLYDVIVIGAGASGLMAALELVQTGKKVAVIEARDRIGGRIHTIINKKFSIPVELGAEFIHGKLELTQTILKNAGIGYMKTSGEFWQNQNNELQKQKDLIKDYTDLEKKFKELKTDIPVAEFIKAYLQADKYEELRFSLKNYVEGYYAGEVSKASTKALSKELTTSDNEQYRIEGGYIKLTNYLHKEAELRGCFFFLLHVATQINWKENFVEVITNKNTFTGKKVLITVPLGVLQSQKICFSPAIKNKIDAAKNLGFGPVIKIILQFENAFWKNKEFTGNKDLKKMGFLFSKEKVPTWWTQQPKDAAMLTGWLGGPHADELKDCSHEEILQKALYSLSSIFTITRQELMQLLKGWHVVNWLTDPFSCGGYAYDVVNGKALRKILKQPLANKVFFAGEALYEGPEIGTVEAALISGRETAHHVIANF